MTTTRHNPIIDKIRKLLTLADPMRGGTEAERDTAMLKAQELMLKHEIKEYELHTAQGTNNELKKANVNHFEYRNEGKTKQWMGRLLSYLASSSNCMSVYLKVSPSLSIWTIVGTPENLDFVRAMFDALHPWLRSQCALARHGARPHNPNAFNRAFFDTAARTIAYRLQQQRREIEAQFQHSNELVLYRRTQNKDYANELFGSLKPGRTQRGYSNAQGHTHGRIAGNNADISHGRKLSE